MKQIVTFGLTLPSYSDEIPYHPHEKYPEHRFNQVSKSFNFPYQLFRRLLFEHGYDKSNFGTPLWNPLKTLIKPGNTVVINPNFVLSYNMSGANIYSVITHPSIIRAAVDYSFKALNGEGKIIIADAPQMDCNWAELMSIIRLDAIKEFYRNEFSFDIDYYDLRNFELIENKKKAYFSNRRLLPGDPLGSVIINLGKKSEFYGLEHENYYGADINRDETIKHHQGETQEYSVSGTILNADCVISIPKMKVHKKVGVTLNIKGLVGINTNKNYLVHYRVGTPSQGGDQLPDGRPKYDSFLIKAQRFLYDKALGKMSKTGDRIYKSALFLYNTILKPFKKVSESTITIDSGNWHGNDSAWRMSSDLAKIFYFADKEGIIQQDAQRKMFCIIDGIIGGDNVGPLAPDDAFSGCLVMSENPFACDMAASKLMGFDIAKLKQFIIINNIEWDFGLRGPEDIEIRFENEIIDGKSFFGNRLNGRLFSYKPHPGWINQIEIE